MMTASAARDDGGMTRREYTLEQLIPFGGGKATQEANAAELARLRAGEAEVRRLRAALAPLVERTPVDHGRMEEALCGYCDGYLGFRAGDPQEHSPECPWLLAREALGLDAAGRRAVGETEE